MDDASLDLKRAAREAAYSMPLEEINPADPELFRTDTMWPYFERLRREDPVHFCPQSRVGAHWSVTRYVVPHAAGATAVTSATRASRP